MNKILGYSEGFHDAAITILDGNKPIYAAHSERYSKIKNDKEVCDEMMGDVNFFGYDEIAFYEKPLLKKLRQARAGQWNHVFNTRSPKLGYDKNFHHHLSHAAAAFQCSPFDKATALVADAIGEFDTMSTWECKYEYGQAKYKKLSSVRYPKSLGLFYSAMTDRVGLKPMEEEYIMMGMAAYGKYDKEIYVEMFHQLNSNMHRGCREFMPHIKNVDIAKNAQQLTQDALKDVVEKIDGPIVYGGGVAHNVVANHEVFRGPHYIFPNPGDAGSSLGAAALAYGRKVKFDTCFLGHTVNKLTNPPGTTWKIHKAVDLLMKGGIIGVCAGRAEFGPRALGNRSLLADPRDPKVKDKVNEIKKRQKFRPFAPSILSEHVDDYFATDKYQNYDYMQYAIPCKRKHDIPSVVHADGSSRVHTVTKESKEHSPLREILEQWYRETGCPVLLNTSLNIKGMPMVNDHKDAKAFENRYGVEVLI